MLSIFLHIPAMMLAVDHYHSWALFGIWIALIETIRFCILQYWCFGDVSQMRLSC